MFFTQLSQADLRPSFFELYAKANLISFIRPAFRYTLETLSFRDHRLLRLAQRSDDLFTLILIVLESRSLVKHNACIAEFFYGLRRASVCINSKTATLDVVPDISDKLTQFWNETLYDPAFSTVRANTNPLSSLEILTTILIEILIPYGKEKLDTLHEQLSVSLFNELAASPSRRDFMQNNACQLHIQPIGFYSSYRSLRYMWQLLEKIRRKLRVYINSLKPLFLKFYPYFSTLYDVTQFFYNFFYLFRKTKYFSPFQHLQGLIIRRLSTDEYRSSVLNAAKPSSWKSRSQVAKLFYVLDTIYSTFKYTMIAGVFLFKFLEKFYSSAKNNSKNLILPPPPARLNPHPDSQYGSAQGVVLQKNASSISNMRDSGRNFPHMGSDLCPMCRKRRNNTTVCRKSGYLFCYACINQYVMNRGKCPITFMPCDEHDLIRIFED